MLAALTRRTPDHVPCCFMIFAALRERCASQEEYVERQLALGLDAFVEIPYREKPRSPLAADLTRLTVTIDPAIAVARRLENAGEREARGERRIRRSSEAAVRATARRRRRRYVPSGGEKRAQRRVRGERKYASRSAFRGDRRRAGRSIDRGRREV